MELEIWDFVLHFVCNLFWLCLFPISQFNGFFFFYVLEGRFDNEIMILSIFINLFSPFFHVLWKFGFIHFSFGWIEN